MTGKVRRVEDAGPPVMDVEGGGDRKDVTQLMPLLGDIPRSGPGPQSVFAGRGYVHDILSAFA